MKSPPFDYARPASLAEVFDLLDLHGDDGRLLAGGQSLIATLNMRLSEPKVLIDLGELPGMRGISLQAGYLRIGALTRHSDIEDSALVARHMPLLAMTAPFVAHRAIRNRGTLGGSLALADPAAEWPTCVLLLDAAIVLASRSGERRVRGADFFTDLYTTAMRPGEVITAVEFPLPAPGVEYAFDELARRHGDYAVMGLAVSARPEGGILRDLRAVFLSAGNVPLRARATEAALEGKRPDAAALRAARAVLAGELQPPADIYHSAAAKLHLAGVLLERLLERLAARRPQGDAHV
jgi:carbon-monoxide dehydrogenase medium subunit